MCVVKTEFVCEKVSRFLWEYLKNHASSEKSRKCYISLLSMVMPEMPKIK